MMDASTTLKNAIKTYLESKVAYQVKLSGQFDPLDEDRIYLEIIISPELGSAGSVELNLTFSSLNAQGIDNKLGEVVNYLQAKGFSPPEDPIYTTLFQLKETGDVELMMSTKGKQQFFSKTAKLTAKYIERGES